MYLDISVFDFHPATQALLLSQAKSWLAVVRVIALRISCSYIITH